MRHKKGFYEVAPVAGFIARQDWTHTMERAERNGLSLQSQKGSTGLLFSVRILAPILDGGLRHIVLAAIQYSLGRHTYMPGIVAEFTCRNLSRLDEATRFTAVAEIRAHLNRYGEQEPYPRLWHSLSRVLTSGKIKEDDRRKERMPILQPLESMERSVMASMGVRVSGWVRRSLSSTSASARDSMDICPPACAAGAAGAGAAVWPLSSS